MRKLIILLFSSFLVMISCKNDCENTQIEVQTLMKKWYKKKISLPEEMKILKDNAIEYKNDVDLSEPKKYTILHFFTADCDKCVNELLMIKTALQNYPKNSKIDYVFIASAPTEIYVLDAIKKTKFPYPIYYEKEYYSFKMMNDLPLSDNLYDTMLLNENQEVLLFGAFYNNEKAKKLYSEVIKCGR